MICKHKKIKKWGVLLGPFRWIGGVSFASLNFVFGFRLWEEKRWKLTMECSEFLILSDLNPDTSIFSFLCPFLQISDASCVPFRQRSVSNVVDTIRIRSKKGSGIEEVRKKGGWKRWLGLLGKRWRRKLRFAKSGLSLVWIIGKSTTTYRLNVDMLALIAYTIFFLPHFLGKRTK